VIVTTALGGLVTLGYALIIFTRSVTEIPLVIQAIDLKIASTTERQKKKGFWEIWASNFFALVATIGFISLHLLNFQFAIGLYLFMFITLNIPLLLMTLRENIFEWKPISPYQRKYAIVYDLVLRRSFIRNHVVLALFCFLV
jgi:hypothetical protein